MRSWPRSPPSGGRRAWGSPCWLKFYERHGRFPRSRGELPDDAVAYVAREVGVPEGELGS